MKRKICETEKDKKLQEYRRQWYLKNKERVNANGRADYKKRAEFYRKYTNDRYHALSPAEKIQFARKVKLRNYGVTPEWYDKKLAEQNGVCAICGLHLPSGKYKKYMHVDHNHSTGSARGILCNGCNTGVGWLDKIDWLAKAIAYLKLYENSPIPD